jgi:hypothetical protein
MQTYRTAMLDEVLKCSSMFVQDLLIGLDSDLWLYRELNFICSHVKIKKTPDTFGRREAVGFEPRSWEYDSCALPQS